MKSSSAFTAAKMVIRWLRWAAVLELVYSAWCGLLYDVVQMVGFFSCPFFLFVAARDARRNRLTTAAVLAAVLVAHFFQGSRAVDGRTVVVVDDELQALHPGSLGGRARCVYIYWSEKPRASVSSVPRSRRHLSTQTLPKRFPE